jgi:hypothetical protein
LVKGRDLFQEPVEEKIIVSIEDVNVEVEPSCQEKIDSELKNQDSNDDSSVIEQQQEENLSTDHELTRKKEMHEQPLQIRIPPQPGDSQNQQWVYLTLLQQQIDILRTQMMHLLNKENINKVSVSTNTASVSLFEEIGTNTNDVPEKVVFTFNY